MRLFLALHLSPQIRQRLKDLLDPLHHHRENLKWVDPDLWHLTLKFLGEVPEEKLSAVTQVVGEATAGCAPFTWTCRGLGAFPDLRRPAVFWAGLDLGAEQVAQVAARLEDHLEDAGWPREERAFHPHVTLARTGRPGRRHAPAPPAPVLQLFRESGGREFGQARAEQVELVRSRLQPQGPSYSRLQSFPLG